MGEDNVVAEASDGGRRRRRSSDPVRAFNVGLDAPRRKPLPETQMPNVPEEPARTSPVELEGIPQRPTLGVPSDTRDGLGRRLSTAMGMSRFPSFRAPTVDPTEDEQYEEDLADVLDTVGTYRFPGSKED